MHISLEQAFCIEFLTEMEHLGNQASRHGHPVKTGMFFRTLFRTVWELEMIIKHLCLNLSKTE